MTADGVIWKIDSGVVWSASFNPWFASPGLPAAFTFWPIIRLRAELPPVAHPISNHGTYWVAAAFAVVFQ